MYQLYPFRMQQQRVRALIAEEETRHRNYVYITGGGCSGFQHGIHI